MKYRKPKPRRDPLKRRAIRKKPGSKPPEFVRAQRKADGKPFSQSQEYKYFWGHLVLEIAKQLPDTRVVCWVNESTQSLQLCACNKFLRQKRQCKRCTLFQGDEHAQVLKGLIESWEQDDLEGLEE